MIFRRRLSTRTMLANAERSHAPEDDELDPDDPVVRLVRQVRAMQDKAVTRRLSEDATTCPTCQQDTRHDLLARSASLSRDYEICIGTYCPNCPPSEEDE